MRGFGFSSETRDSTSSLLYSVEGYAGASAVAWPHPQIASAPVAQSVIHAAPATTTRAVGHPAAAKVAAHVVKAHKAKAVKHPAVKRIKIKDTREKAF